MKTDKTENYICVLFGAGAEKSFGMSEGEDFAKIVLGTQNADEMNKAIKNFYTNKKLNDWYPNYCDYNYYDNDKLLKACIKKKRLENFFNHEIKNSKSFEKEIEEEVNRAKKEKTEAAIISKYTSYMGLIDEHFHTLISPKPLGKKKFWNVVSCYTRAYFDLTGKMMKQLEKREMLERDYMSFLKNPTQTFKKWKEFVDGTSLKENYYSIIKDKAVKVVTTNYTPICEYVSGITDIAYIHGKLNLFESPFELKVYDILDESYKDKDDDVRFPYLTIQSGIKPVIEERQIKEYSNMLDYINNSKTLLIVGYRINCDDNHLNSVIRSYALSGKDVVFFDFNGEIGEENVLKKLRINKCIKNFRCIHINKQDCLDKFSKEIERTTK